jgi:hypothetical protein
MSKVYYISSFEGGANLHGGTLRSMQIREVLNEIFHDIHELNFDFQIKPVPLGAAPSLMRPAMFKKMLEGLSLPGGLKLASLLKQVTRCIPKNSCVCLEICGVNSILLGHALINCGCRIICFPHNIEALVRGVKTRIFYDEFSWMRMELEVYRKAVKVFAISSFDRAILGSLGVDADVFPYFPCSQRMAFLSKINKTREDNCPKGDLLLFSSVNNHPTRVAVEGFITAFAEHAPSCKFNLLVAGRGTRIFHQFDGEKIRVLGEVNEEDAKSLLQQASFSIVPAIQTSGFLTKLVENNLIRLPTLVLGSYLQASSLEGYGIFMQANSSIANAIKTLNEPLNKSFSKFERTDICIQF